MILCCPSSIVINQLSSVGINKLLSVGQSLIIFKDLRLRFRRGDQKVRGKVLLFLIAFIDSNGNSQIETTIHSKLTELEI